jgi:hypothetical protein
MRFRFGRRRRAGAAPTGGAASEPEPADAPEAALPEPPETAPQPAPAESSQQPEAGPAPTEPLVPESLDRALQRLRAEIPERQEDGSR